MARTYSGTPEPRYVEKAKYAENGGGGVTVDELIDKTAAGIGVSIDKTEDESKMQIGLDCPSIILTDDQIVEGDNPTFELTEEQIAIIENVNATIIFVNAESANLGATYYKRYCTDENDKIRFIAIKYDIGSGDEITQLDAEALVFSPETAYLVYSTFPISQEIGHVVHSASTETVGSWDCPVLTTAQVNEIYGYLINGESVVVADVNDEIYFKATFADSSTSRPSIVIQYYWLGWIDYQIGTNNEVETTPHPLPDISGKLDANKQAIANVGGLVVPTQAPTDTILPAIETDREQAQVYLGDGLELENASSPYLLKVTGIKEQRNGDTMSPWVGTQAQYDAITTKSSTTIYYIVG